MSKLFGRETKRSLQVKRVQQERKNIIQGAVGDVYYKWISQAVAGEALGKYDKKLKENIRKAEREINS